METQKSEKTVQMENKILSLLRQNKDGMTLTGIGKQLIDADKTHREYMSALNPIRFRLMALLKECRVSIRKEKSERSELDKIVYWMV